MTETTESTEYPQDKNLPTEPMRCSNCGTLPGFYSSRSDADLLLRCAKCNNDLDVKLCEGAASYRRRNKRKTPFPKGQ